MATNEKEERKGSPRRSKRPRKRARPRRSADQGLQPLPASIDPSLYINRELSWLEFNQRVLDEANDPSHPLLERIKFLSIVSSNLDEFFMIRVAAIKEQIFADLVEYSPDERIPLQQLKSIHQRAASMMRDMSRCFWKTLHPLLIESGIHLLRVQHLPSEERASLELVFANEIFPVLTPLAFDPGHPFPYISNLSLNLAVVVTDHEGNEKFARVKVPDVLPRLLLVPTKDKRSQTKMVWLEDVIVNNLGMLFPGMAVKEAYGFRVTRNADLEIQEDEAEDLIRSIEESIKLRRFGSVVRVAVEKTMPQRIKDILVENLEITPDDVYDIEPPMGLGHLMELMKLPRPELKDAPHYSVSPFTDDDPDVIFSSLRQKDVLLHHPYDSFLPVVQFLTAAVNDPNVLAIKQTLYRIGSESPLIALLIRAAESGKQVAVLVELKARFDEENNIIWAKQLERAGIHVVYGLVGLKTHAKMAMVVRREQTILRRYVHLGTGNYNPSTARLYTDFSLLTSREDITRDVAEVFNYLTGYSTRTEYQKLCVAPINLRSRLTALIQREIDHAKSGKPARLIFKMNALTDIATLGLLYSASATGVQVDLIVRGVCCIRPGVKQFSENIRVRSIVGRFLEHSRVYYFENNGKPEIYLGSADLMGRNLDRRVELMFPVEDTTLCDIVKAEALDEGLADNVRARLLQTDGSYIRSTPLNGSAAIESQSRLIMARQKLKGTIQPSDQTTSSSA